VARSIGKTPVLARVAESVAAGREDGRERLRGRFPVRSASNGRPGGRHEPEGLPRRIRASTDDTSGEESGPSGSDEDRVVDTGADPIRGPELLAPERIGQVSRPIGLCFVQSATATSGGEGTSRDNVGFVGGKTSEG